MGNTIKGNNFTKTCAKKMLPALRKLKRKYESDLYIRCPLCEIDKGCSACPWRVFYHQHCNDEGMEYKPYYGENTSTRLERVDEWIDKCVTKIEE